MSKKVSINKKAFIKDFNAKMEPSIYAPMTKIDKQKVRTGKAYVESDNFATLLDWIFHSISARLIKLL